MAKQTENIFESILNQYQATVTEERWSTGIRVMDKTLGGGFAPGYCYGMYGVPGAGKTTIAMQMARALCKQGKKVIYVDVEKSFNTEQAESFGLNPFIENRQFITLAMSRFSDIDKLIMSIESESAPVDFIIIDTISMVRESIKVDLKVEDERPGLHARQTKFILNKLKDVFYKRGIVSLIMFQSSANFDMNGGTNPYAPKYKQQTGYAGLHVPDVIVRIDIGASIKNENNEQIGQVVKISSDKNKFAPPKKVISRNFYFGRGIPKREEILEDAIAAGIITVGAAGYYTLPNGEKVHGVSALRELPKETIAAIQEQLAD